MDENRCFGYCEVCGEKVTDKHGEYYVNADGEIFCSVECAMDHYGIVKLEV